MVNITIKEIGMKLIQAGRLQTTPLCIYGSETYPKGAIQISKVNRCIARAIFTLSINKEIDALYIGENVLEECCPGGQAWFGYKVFVPELKYFLSTGLKSYRGGASEFLIANPHLAEQRLNSIGKITPLGKYTVIKKYDSIDEQNFNANAFLCFGISEQIRNLCSLAFFGSEQGFSIQIPWGASCASFVSYPASICENGPKNCIIIGPADPTGNNWFPESFCSIGVPFEIAKRMANDLNDSFISKRAEIAYPLNRTF
jgi:hypothetical protein